MEHPTFSAFGALLQEARTRRRLSQQVLATALGVHRNTIGTWERGDGLPQSRGLVLELARQLRLDEAETRQLLEASLTTLAPYWCVPFARNPYFTGREALLERLHTLLSASQSVALTRSYALSGLGGIGKTHLAVEYAYRHALEYRAIFWLAAETSERLLASFLRIAEVLQLPERAEAKQQQVVAAVQRWLRTHGQWLLIWDNVEDLDLLQRFLPPAPSGAHLLTTRQAALGPLAQVLEVPPMAPAEGLRLLLHRAKVLSTTNSGDALQQFVLRRPIEAAAAEALVQQLEGLPLALDQAGAYVEETAGSLADYLRLYQTRRTELLNRRGTVGSEHPASVVTTWSVAFERLERAHPAAADVLRVCAFVHPEAIPEELFTRGAAHLGERLGPVASDPLQWPEALQAVLSSSLLRRHAEDHTLSIHRLVQAVLHDELEATTAQQWRERVVLAMHAAFPKPVFAAWPQCERLVPHALICRQWLDQREDAPPEAACLLYKAGSYLRDRGHYAEAEPLLVQALALQEQQLGASHPQVAATLAGIASLSLLQGKYQHAESLQQRALSIREQFLGPAHPDVAASLNDLGLIYCDLGREKRAESLQQHALTIREHFLGPTHPQTAESLHSLALHAWGQGKYQQAESLLKRAVSINEQQLGPTHPETARCLRHLGSLYREQGKYEQAEPLLRCALATHEQQLGETHPFTALSMAGMGVLYREQGKYEQAEPLLERALSICEEQLGPNHSGSAEVLDHLASLYREQGKYEQAEPLFQRAVWLREKLTGPDHPDVAFSLQGLGALYREQGQYEQAELLLERALSICEEQLGPEHPSIARCLRHLGPLYRVQGRDAEALSSLHRALVIYEHALGPEHPDTARCLQELAQLAQDQGRLIEAELLYQRVLTIQEQKLGAMHSRVADTLEQYAHLLGQMHREEEAVALHARTQAIRNLHLQHDAQP